MFTEEMQAKGGIRKLLSLIMAVLIIFSDVAVLADLLLEEKINNEEIIEEVIEEVIEEIDNDSVGSKLSDSKNESDKDIREDSYEIRYINDKTDELIEIEENLLPNEEIKVEAKLLEGYLLKSKSIKTLSNDDKVEFRYVPKSENQFINDYTVRHVVEIDGKYIDIVDRDIGQSYSGSFVIKEPLNIKGYKPLTEGKQTLIVDSLGKNELVFIYDEIKSNTFSSGYDYEYLEQPLVDVIIRAVDSEGNQLEYNGEKVETVLYGQSTTVDEDVFMVLDPRDFANDVKVKTDNKYQAAYNSSIGVSLLDINSENQVIVDFEFKEVIDSKSKNMYVIEHVGNVYQEIGKNVVGLEYLIQSTEVGIGKFKSKIEPVPKNELKYSEYINEYEIIKIDNITGKEEKVNYNDDLEVELKEENKTYKVILKYDVKGKKEGKISEIDAANVGFDVIRDNIKSREEILTKLSVNHLDTKDNKPLVDAEIYDETVKGIYVTYDYLTEKDDEVFIDYTHVDKLAKREFMNNKAENSIDHMYEFTGDQIPVDYDVICIDADTGKEIKRYGSSGFHTKEEIVYAPDLAEDGIHNYYLKSESPLIKVLDRTKNNDFVFKYKKNEKPGEGAYIVKHVEEYVTETGQKIYKDILDPRLGFDMDGAEISIKDENILDIKGYDFIGFNPEDGKVKIEENKTKKLFVIYEKNGKEIEIPEIENKPEKMNAMYEVHYDLVDMAELYGVLTKIPEDEEHEAVVGVTITRKAENVVNHTIDKNIKSVDIIENGDISKGENLIRFKYAQLDEDNQAQYEVQHIYEEKDEKVVFHRTTGVGKIGTEVESDPIESPDYKYLEEDDRNKDNYITLKKEVDGHKNILKLYYEKVSDNPEIIDPETRRSYEVRHIDLDDNDKNIIPVETHIGAVGQTLSIYAEEFDDYIRETPSPQTLEITEDGELVVIFGYRNIAKGDKAKYVVRHIEEFEEDGETKYRDIIDPRLGEDEDGAMISIKEEDRLVFKGYDFDRYEPTIGEIELEKGKKNELKVIYKADEDQDKGIVDPEEENKPDKMNAMYEVHYNEVDMSELYDALTAIPNNERHEAVVGVTITKTAPDVLNYTIDKKVKSTVIVEESKKEEKDNLIEFKYAQLDEDNQAQYEVQHIYEENDEKVVFHRTTGVGKIGTEVESDPIESPDYKYLEEDDRNKDNYITLRKEVDGHKNILKLYYEKVSDNPEIIDPETRRSYEVRHIDLDDNDADIIDPETHIGAVGQTLSIYAEEFDDYIRETPSPQTLEITADGELLVIFGYRNITKGDKAKYVVRHIEEFEEDGETKYRDIIDPRLGEDEDGAIISIKEEDRLVFKGYDFDRYEPTIGEIELEKGKKNELKVIYKADEDQDKGIVDPEEENKPEKMNADYFVDYLKDDGSKPVGYHPREDLKAVVGVTITRKYKPINNTNVINDIDQTTIVENDKVVEGKDNQIIFKYRELGGIFYEVHHLDAETDEEIERTVGKGTEGSLISRIPSNYKGYEYAKEDPRNQSDGMVLKQGAENIMRLYYTNVDGEGPIDPPWKENNAYFVNYVDVDTGEPIRDRLILEGPENEEVYVESMNLENDGWILVSKSPVKHVISTVESENQIVFEYKQRDKFKNEIYTVRHVDRRKGDNGEDIDVDIVDPRIGEDYAGAVVSGVGHEIDFEGYSHIGYDPESGEITVTEGINKVLKLLYTEDDSDGEITPEEEDKKDKNAKYEVHYNIVDISELYDALTAIPDNERHEAVVGVTITKTAPDVLNYTIDKKVKSTVIVEEAKKEEKDNLIEFKYAELDEDNQVQYEVQHIYEDKDNNDKEVVFHRTTGVGKIGTEVESDPIESPDYKYLEEDDRNKDNYITLRKEVDGHKNILKLYYEKVSDNPEIIDPETRRSYEVRHIDLDDNDADIIDPETHIGAVGQTLSIYAEEFDDYIRETPSPQTLEVTEDGELVVTFGYRNIAKGDKAKYVVRHIEEFKEKDGEIKYRDIIDPRLGEDEDGAVISIKEEDRLVFKGYDFDRYEPTIGEIELEKGKKNELKVIYKADEDQDKGIVDPEEENKPDKMNAMYEVHYNEVDMSELYDALTAIPNNERHEAVVGVTITKTAPDVVGYTIDNNVKSTVIVEEAKKEIDDNLIEFRYAKVGDGQVEYEIRHIYNADWTNEAEDHIILTTTGVAKVGSKVLRIPEELAGYEYDEDHPGNVDRGMILKADSSENIMKIYYDEDGEDIVDPEPEVRKKYKVKYVEEGTGKEVSETEHYVGAVGQEILVNAIEDIEGYVLVSKTPYKLSITEDSTEDDLTIIFEYRSTDVDPDEAMYIVRHMEKSELSTGEVIYKDIIKPRLGVDKLGAVIGIENEDILDLKGYKFLEFEPESGEIELIEDDKNEIRVIYEEDEDSGTIDPEEEDKPEKMNADYEVHYRLVEMSELYDALLGIPADEKHSAVVGVTITRTAPDVINHTLDKKIKSTLIVAEADKEENDNLIEFKYAELDEDNQAQYEVQHIYEENDEKVVFHRTTGVGKIGTEVESDPIESPDYKYLEEDDRNKDNYITLRKEVDGHKNILKLYYEKVSDNPEIIDPETRRSYEVRHIDLDDNDADIIDPETHIGAVGQTLSIYAEEFDDYIRETPSPQTLEITADGELLVIFGYRNITKGDKAKYVVRHIEEFEEDGETKYRDIIDPRLGEDEDGAIISIKEEDRLVFKGYDFDRYEPTIGEIELEKGKKNELKVIYKADEDQDKGIVDPEEENKPEKMNADYFVDYLKDDGSKPVGYHPREDLKAVVGVTITRKYKPINNTNVINDIDQTTIVENDKVVEGKDNQIIFKYRELGGIFYEVHHLDAETDEEIERTVGKGTEGSLISRIPSNYKGYEYAKEDPRNQSDGMVLKQGAENIMRLYYTNVDGEGPIDPPWKENNAYFVNYVDVDTGEPIRDRLILEGPENEEVYVESMNLENDGWILVSKSPVKHVISTVESENQIVFEYKQRDKFKNEIYTVRHVDRRKGDNGEDIDVDIVDPRIGEDYAGAVVSGVGHEIDFEGYSHIGYDPESGEITVTEGINKVLKLLYTEDDSDGEITPEEEDKKDKNAKYEVHYNIVDISELYDALLQVPENEEHNAVVGVTIIKTAPDVINYTVDKKVKSTEIVRDGDISKGENLIEFKYAELDEDNQAQYEVQHIYEDNKKEVVFHRTTGVGKIGTEVESDPIESPDYKYLEEDDRNIDNYITLNKEVDGHKNILKLYYEKVSDNPEIIDPETRRSYEVRHIDLDDNDKNIIPVETHIGAVGQTLSIYAEEFDDYIRETPSPQTLEIIEDGELVVIFGYRNITKGDKAKYVVRHIEEFEEDGEVKYRDIIDPRLGEDEDGAIISIKEEDRLVFKGYDFDRYEPTIGEIELEKGKKNELKVIYIADEDQDEGIVDPEEENKPDKMNAMYEVHYNEVDMSELYDALTAIPDNERHEAVVGVTITKTAPDVLNYTIDKKVKSTVIVEEAKKEEKDNLIEFKYAELDEDNQVQYEVQHIYEDKDNNDKEVVFHRTTGVGKIGTEVESDPIESPDYKYLEEDDRNKDNYITLRKEVDGHKNILKLYYEKVSDNPEIIDPETRRSYEVRHIDLDDNDADIIDPETHIGAVGQTLSIYAEEFDDYIRETPSPQTLEVTEDGELVVTFGYRNIAKGDKAKYVVRHIEEFKEKDGEIKYRDIIDPRLGEDEDGAVISIKEEDRLVFKGYDFDRYEPTIGEIELEKGKKNELKVIYKADEDQDKGIVDPEEENKPDKMNAMYEVHYNEVDMSELYDALTAIPNNERHEAVVGVTITKTAPDVVGYTIDNNVKSTVIVEEAKKEIDDNLIEFRYAKVGDGQVEYEIRHIYNADWTNEAEDHIILTTTGVAKVGSKVLRIPEELAGYEYDEDHPGNVDRGMILKADSSENIMKIYYDEDGEDIVDPEPEVRKKYKVKYVEEGTGKEVSETEHYVGAVGQEILVNAIEDIEGYVLVSKTPYKLAITENSTEEDLTIIFEYRSTDVDPDEAMYIVRHMEKSELSTGEVIYKDIIKPRIGIDKLGAIVSIEKDDILDLKGYKFLEFEPELGEIELIKDNKNELRVIYESDEESGTIDPEEEDKDENMYSKYEIDYKLENGEQKPGNFPELEIYEDAVVGVTITRRYIDIGGYTVDEEIKSTLILPREEVGINDNKINFLYTAEPTGGGGGGGRRPVEEVEEKIEFMLNPNHISYIGGYPDGTVRPQNDVARQEIAAVIFRVLDPDFRETIRTTTHNFPDVPSYTWSLEEIATAASQNIVEGYPSGVFKPRDNATRAEMAAMIARFRGIEPDIMDSKFSDISGHWAEGYVNALAKEGLVLGYKGTNEYRPNEQISRAEFVTIMNRVLDRGTTVENMLDDRQEFRDLEKSRWYYEGMHEAINAHEFEMEDGIEIWTHILKDHKVGQEIISETGKEVVVPVEDEENLEKKE